MAASRWARSCVELLLQPAHLGPQDGVLLGYSELRGGDDVTEQGLGHDWSGLSDGERVSPAPRVHGRRELWYPQGDRPGHAGQREDCLLPVSGGCRVRHAVVNPELPCAASSARVDPRHEPGARGPSSAASTRGRRRRRPLERRPRPGRRAGCAPSPPARPPRPARGRTSGSPRPARRRRRGRPRATGHDAPRSAGGAGSVGQL